MDCSIYFFFSVHKIKAHNSLKKETIQIKFVIIPLNFIEQRAAPHFLWAVSTKLQQL